MRSYSILPSYSNQSFEILWKKYVSWSEIGCGPKRSAFFVALQSNAPAIPDLIEIFWKKPAVLGCNPEIEHFYQFCASGRFFNCQNDGRFTAYPLIVFNILIKIYRFLRLILHFFLEQLPILNTLKRAKRIIILVLGMASITRKGCDIIRSN